MMEPDRWEQIERLYHAALEHESDARGTFLAEACGGDEELRREVVSLLHYDEGPAIFCEAPILEFVAQLQAEERAAEMFDSLAPLGDGLTTPESESPPAAPIFIGDHRILRKLGEGGMGVVYEAEQQNPRRHVALKLIRGGRLVDEYQVKLFQREAQALARLKHPGIAAIYEAGRTDEGRHYFVMELAPGVPLLDYVKGARPTGRRAPSGVKQRLELFIKVCEAISYAHQRGVIHRDLKHTNILVADESEGQSLGGSIVSRVELKVLDFGLARIIDEDGAGASGLSQAGQVRGTLPYMSPEQVRGNPDKIDVRADVYALGVILYELLTERLPYDFENTTAPQAIRIICEDSPKPLSRVWNGSRDSEGGKAERIDRDVETIVLKALEKEPELRYQSAAAMAEDVRRYLTNQPIQARPPSALYQFRKLVARHKAPFALLAAVFVLLLGFAVTMATLTARIARERDKAVAAERVAAEQRDAAEQARNAEREQRDAAEQARNDEQDQRLLAEANLNRAEEQRMRAEQQELSNRRLLYAAHMNLAMQAWEAADIRRMRGLVESHIPKPGEEDMRGFEWYYLWRLYHRALLTLEGHLGRVSSVAFSPDGKRLATGSEDGAAKLWDAATGRVLITLIEHAAPVMGVPVIGLKVMPVAFSPDGERLATGSQDGAARLWDLGAGRELAVLKGHADRVTSVAYSPDGERLATTSSDRTVKLWDPATGQVLITLRGHADGVYAVAFSPDGKRLATASSDRTVKLWDAATGRELITLKGHADGVYAVAFSPDGKKLATGSWDRTAKLWDAATHQELITLKGHAAPVMSVAFMPDGKRLATASYDRTVRLWDAATGQELATFTGHVDGIRSLAVAPDGRLATGSDDWAVKLWDAGAGQEFITLKGHAEGVYAAAFSPDSKRLATASSDRTVKLWDAGAGQELITLRGHGNIVISLAFSPDGKRLATASWDHTVKLWDAGAGSELATLKGRVSTVSSVAISPDGKRLAAGSFDRAVKLWDAATGRELITLKGYVDGVSAAAFSPDGKRLAAGSYNGTVRLWDAGVGQELITLYGHRDAVRSLAFSPDGKRLATASSDRTVKLWDAATGRELITLKGHADGVYAVAFSPDGKRLATASSDRTAKLWDAATGQELITLKGHADGVYAVAFSPDGKRLATASSDRTVKLWDAATEKEMLVRSKQ